MPHTAPTRPKLVLVIVVDQLRTDYLELLEPLYAQGGLRRLMTQGVYMPDVRWTPSRLDAASATASLMTGANPEATGVPSARVYSAKAMKSVPALADDHTVGSFTNEAYSPSALRLSTLADELMIDGAGLPLAHAIALDPQVAIALGGHAGSGAVWPDVNTGRWASSAYYKDLPEPAARANYQRPLSSRIDTMQWRPLLPLTSYPGLPAQKRQYAFRHTFPSSDRDVYRKLVASPKGNTEVTDLAIDYIRSLRVGQRGDAVDMLCLGLTAAPFKYVKDADYRLELEDTYLRLDRDIERLLNAADRALGSDNVVVMLASTGYYDDSAPDDPKYRIPTGEFSARRATSLLNAYLSSLYSPADYVTAYADGAFYLNATALERAGADVTTAAAKSKEFLSKMAGVDQVYTLSDLLTPQTDAASRLALSVDPTSAADLYIEITPGWTQTDDTRTPPVSRTVRRGRPLTPAMIAAPGLSAKHLTDPVNPLQLAPTLSSLLHMRTPAGAAATPMHLHN